MPVITVRMEEDLVLKLEELAQLRGITRGSLIKELLQEALKSQASGRLREAVRALREGRQPHATVDWPRIERELLQTAPRFSTVEEALASSRGRALETL